MAHTAIGEVVRALRELHDAVEAMADLGKRRQLTVSPRMEDALTAAKDVLDKWPDPRSTTPD